MIALFIILFFYTASPDSEATIFAEQQYTISGHVRDARSGEELIGANVYIRNISEGTVTNQYGFYSLTLEEGHYTIGYSYVGYASVEKKIILENNQSINIELQETS